MTEAIVHADGRLVFQGRTFRCALGRAGVVPANASAKAMAAPPPAYCPCAASTTAPTG